MVYLTSYILVNRGIVLNHSQYTFIYINLRHSVFRPDRHAEHRRWPVAGPPGGGGGGGLLSHHFIQRSLRRRLAADHKLL